MKNWFRNFMTGRNGPDDLARLLSFAGCIILIPALFLKNGSLLQLLLWAAAFGCLIAGYFRIFSRSVYKRQAENQAYVQWKYARMEQVRQWKARQGQRRLYRFYRCPHCRTMARVPRGHGRIQITCPHCGTSFIRKS